ncbi:MAG: hypothetical protein HY577_01160 [Candidatus Nealsonbacteria bacterium]|nr:hypothetical protein [Candidatus Nealsonbacteria bacterium]
MIFKIDQRIFGQYPDVLLGIVVVKNINNSGENSEILEFLRSAESKLSEKIGQIPLAEHPNILAWREAYRKFGAKPKDYPSSIENLVRRVLKGENIRHINKLVDIYNFVSLKYLVPVGGEDVDKISGDIILTFADDGEPPVVLLGEKEARPPHKDEVIYKDDNGAICRRWNWKEAERTKMTEATNNAFLIIEALPPTSRVVLEQAANEFVDQIKKFCGGDISWAILDKSQSEILLI